MTFPTAIAFHRVQESDKLRAEILERTRHLESLLDDVLACRVSVDAVSRLFHHGRHYGVCVRATLPCAEIEAGGTPTPTALHEDASMTVAETFNELTHRFEDFVQRRCLSCSKYNPSRRR